MLSRMRRSGLAPALLLFVALSGCSAMEQQRLEYRASGSLPPLQVPAGLDTPQGEAVLPLPEINAPLAEVDVTPPTELLDGLNAVEDTVDSGGDSRPADGD